MKILLSPAKKMRVANPVSAFSATQPALLTKTTQLAQLLKELSLTELGKILGASGTTLHQAFQMYQQFGTSFSAEIPAIYAYVGTAYTALNALTLDDESLIFAQKHLRIFSGLYGILRAGDLIQPYRLDVGNRMKPEGYKNLYDYWQPAVNKFLADENENELIFNLASEEYFKLIDPTCFANCKILTLSFKEFRNGSLRSVSPAVKKARGLMARYIIDRQIMDTESVKEFTGDGYLYSPDHSSNSEYVFIR
ncbi:MAG: YaaA family protein [Bacteroidales bacterium]